MPANKPYPGENPAAAAKRIARNKALQVKNPDAIKNKGDIMGNGNIAETIKNLGGGYSGLARGMLGAYLSPISISIGKGKNGYAEKTGKKIKTTS